MKNLDIQYVLDVIKTCVKNNMNDEIKQNKEINIAVQCGSLGDRCGINTYANRVVNYLNKIDGVNAFTFKNKLRKSQKVDLINVQYEPGVCPPQMLNYLIHTYTQPIVVTCHFTGPNQLPSFYAILDGIIFHSENQIVGEPWGHTVIKHPAMVFPEKGKEKMRKKYGLPLDKKIIGTMGFIAGTGKVLPSMIEYILRDIKDDEFLYCMTSFWKGGDFSATSEINKIVKRLGKESQFRIDTDFVPIEELNEKMQTCDLLFSWNNSTMPGGNSGAAMDMIGARRKVIVKDAPHYYEALNIEGVLKGRQKQEDFAKDVLNALRNEDLDNVPDPEPYSWEVLIKKQLDYFYEILGE